MTTATQLPPTPSVVELQHLSDSIDSLDVYIIQPLDDMKVLCCNAGLHDEFFEAYRAVKEAKQKMQFLQFQIRPRQ